MTFPLSKTDLLKIARGAALAAGGALVAYFGSEVVPNLDQSTALGGLIAAAASVLLNVARKALARVNAEAAGESD